MLLIIISFLNSNINFFIDLYYFVAIFLYYIIISKAVIKCKINFVFKIYLQHLMKALLYDK